MAAYYFALLIACTTYMRNIIIIRKIEILSIMYDIHNINQKIVIYTYKIVNIAQKLKMLNIGFINITYHFIEKWRF